MLRILATICAVGLAAAAIAAPALAQSYIGAERCGACHRFEYQAWKAGPHATAHTSLDQEQINDPKCTTCHTMVVEQAGVELTGVQCERCHGPGKYYHPSYVMKDAELARAVGLLEPTPERCVQCHTEGAPSIKPFDYERMWKRIDHGKEARQVWLELQRAKQEEKKTP